MKCGRELTSTEIALHRKLVNRGAAEFMCISCLAENFMVSEEAIRENVNLQNLRLPRRKNPIAAGAKRSFAIFFAFCEKYCKKVLQFAKRHDIINKL